MKLSRYNPLTAIRSFFDRRKLVYLGSSDVASYHSSILLGREWREVEHIEFYASKSGKRVIKGIEKHDIPKLLATNRVVAQWYRDPGIDPFSLIPEYPSKFSQASYERSA